MTPAYDRRACLEMASQVVPPTPACAIVDFSDPRFGNRCPMKFPYGLSDFATLIQEGYFYQDRTDRIPQLEEAGRQLIFIRPRRFGKSLLLKSGRAIRGAV